MQPFNNEIIAAIQTGLNQSNKGSHGNVRSQLQPGFTAPRGRNLRTTDGQPICSNCNRVGHVARYCLGRQNTQQQAQPNRFCGSYRNISDKPNQQNQQHYQHKNTSLNGKLNEMGSLQWGN